MTSRPERLRDYELACRLCAQVREEAADSNIPLPGSGFAAYMTAVWPTMKGASCFQYSLFLLDRLAALGFGPDRARELGIYIRLNGGHQQFDSHSVVLVEHEGRFVICDPTNGLALELAESGAPATKAEVQFAVRCGHPEWIRNRYLTPAGDHYVATEDYEGQCHYYANCRPADTEDYWDSWLHGRYDAVVGPVPPYAAIYDPMGETVKVTRNGVPETYPCNPISWVISTEHVVLPAGLSWVMLRPMAFGVAPGIPKGGNADA